MCVCVCVCVCVCMHNKMISGKGNFRLNVKKKIPDHERTIGLQSGFSREEVETPSILLWE